MKPQQEVVQDQYIPIVASVINSNLEHSSVFFYWAVIGFEGTQALCT